MPAEWRLEDTDKRRLRHGGSMITTEKITTTDVKRFNKNRIFRLIHYADKISRQEIADILQLSLPTVNQNLKLLLEKNLIDFVGNFESTGGRKAQAITVNGMSKCAVSVNLSDAGIKVSLVDLKGEIVFSEKKSISFTEDAVYSESIAQLVKDVISRNNVADEDVLGVGITIPGIFDNDNKTLVFSPTMGIRNYPIAELTKAIPYTCRATNITRANAYAEFWFDRKFENLTMNNVEDFNRSAASGQSDAKLYVMLNTGVGGAYIDKEKLQTGVHNRYGEFGHMTIHPHGRKCFCGKEGCFEAYVSARRLSTEQDCTLDEFFSQLQQENPRFIKVFEEYLDDLTTGINNLYIMCDGNVVVGGPVAKYLVPYQDKIRRMLVEKYSFDTDGLYFSFAQCTAEQADTGAALMFLGEFISNI